MGNQKKSIAEFQDTKKFKEMAKSKGRNKDEKNLR